MGNKINIAELLKDCPRGMELDCMMYENLYFNSLNADYDGTINCYTLIDGVETSINFSKYGTFNSHKGAKCVIFPKGKTTWEGFVPPYMFKDGDVVVDIEGAIIIYKGITASGYFGSFVSLDHYNQFIPHYESYLNYIRFATEEEKAKLFQAIEDNGYNWNPETKTLEKLIKPKFKVGDRIKHKSTGDVYKIMFVLSNRGVYDVATTNEIGRSIEIEEQDNYELEKFDITTLKPFDKVLVRDNNTQKWTADLFSLFDKSLLYPYSCVGHYTNQCIPYEGNEHLLGTTNDCDDFYKTWEE